MDTPEHINTEVGDKYELIRLLGEGGMGAVYLGRHKLIGKLVAVKILSHVLVKNEGYVKRFYREARAAASIHHPNVVDVLDIGATEHGQPYIVMEYLVGEGLDTILERAAPMDLATAAAIIEPALLALDQAHKVKIVHRDLKPENIFVVSRENTDTNTVKIIDFGISKVLHKPDATQLTQDGSLLGTPAYMSPEQVSASKTLDHRSDIFSIGVIFFELLTGEQPFKGGTPFDVMLSVVSEDPLPDPRTMNANFPASALPIIERAMAKDTEDCFQSAEEMRLALEDVCNLDEGRANLKLIMDTATDTTVAMGNLGGTVTEEIDSVSALEILTGIGTHSSPRVAKRLKNFRRSVMTATIFILFAALAAALGYIYFGRQLERGIAAATEQPSVPNGVGRGESVEPMDSPDRDDYPLAYEIASVSSEDSTSEDKENCAESAAGCEIPGAAEGHADSETTPDVDGVDPQEEGGEDADDIDVAKQPTDTNLSEDANEKSSASKTSRQVKPKAKKKRHKSRARARSAASGHKHKKSIKRKHSKGKKRGAGKKKRRHKKRRKRRR